MLAHHRRRVVHFNVTEHAAAWTAQQIVAAFPGDSAPSYLLRDRAQVYGEQFRHRVKGMRSRKFLRRSIALRPLWPIERVHWNTESPT